MNKTMTKPYHSSNSHSNSSHSNSSQPNTFHPNNRHQGNYDLLALSNALPELSSFIIQNPKGKDTIDFSNPQAVKLLNKALLFTQYKLTYWDIPDGFLCPPIPSRADYIHHIADVLKLTGETGADGKKGIRALDIGTGANLIYPIVGSQEYGWRFLATDIDPVSIENVKFIIAKNACLKNKIRVKLQKNPEKIFHGIIDEKERFDVSICNPPFHASLEQAMASNQRKQRNLKQNKHKRNQQQYSSSPLSTPKQSVKQNFGGQKAELWCEGGEIGFLQRMATESKEFAEQVVWFSTLVSKADNITPLTKLLTKLGASRIKEIQMRHGQKKTRVVAWGW